MYPMWHPPAQADPGDEQPADDGYQRLESWEFDRLVALGFGAGEAAALVATHASWHDAQRLLARGCPREVVLEILL